MGEHTRGPWKVVEQWTTGASIKATTDQPMDTAIATAHGSIFARLVSPEAMLANARLIAASPELLEALEKAVQLAGVARDWNLYEVEIDKKMVGVLELEESFRAAIKKARGEG